MNQCTGKTKSGLRCKRIINGKKYCNQHKGGKRYKQRGGNADLTLGKDCTAAHVKFNRTMCRRGKLEPKVTLMLHPDKNLSCADEAGAKFSDFSNCCSNPDCVNPFPTPEERMIQYLNGLDQPKIIYMGIMYYYFEAFNTMIYNGSYKFNPSPLCNEIMRLISNYGNEQGKNAAKDLDSKMRTYFEKMNREYSNFEINDAKKILYPFIAPNSETAAQIIKKDGILYPVNEEGLIKVLNETQFDRAYNKYRKIIERYHDAVIINEPILRHHRRADEIIRSIGNEFDRIDRIK